MTWNVPRMIGVALLMSGVVVTAFALAAAETSGQDGQDEPVLAAVFQPNPQDWQIETAGAADIVGEADGQMGIVSGKAGRISLLGKKDYPVNTEHLLKFRFLPGEGSLGSITVRLGRHDLKDNSEKGLSVTLSAADESSLGCQFHNGLVEDQSKAYIRTTYSLAGLETSKEGWPDDYRRRVERVYSGLPTVTEKWFTLRIVSLKDRVRAFVDDRLFGEWLVAGGTARGKMAIDLAGAMLLISVRTGAYDADSPYVTVGLDGYVNAGEIDGSRLVRDGVIGSLDPVQVAGVPFVLPEPDAAGNDHIDVGESWCKYGTLVGGYLTTNRGVFGGRWRSALTVNPTRIQVALPKEAYGKLHVLAVADEEPDCVPKFTAQFYAPSSGFPVSAEATVPFLSTKASEAKRLPIQLADGKKGALYLVTIELEVDRLAELCQLETVSNTTRDTNGRTMLGLELTKVVQPFRAYPDPISYGMHGAGLPSAVHVYAMTLEKPRIEVDLQPDTLAHTWVAPETPRYTAKLTNNTNASRKVSLILRTESYGGGESTESSKQIVVAAKGTATASFSLKLERYGSHQATLEAVDGDQTWTAKRDLAYLHTDTRTRGGWQRGQGALFGYWGYGAGHYGAPGAQELLIMAKAGCETRAMGNFSQSAEAAAIGKKYRMKTLPAFDGYDKWSFSGFASDLRAGMDPCAAEAKQLNELKRLKLPATELDDSVYLGFFAEPQVGPITHGNLPSYWGEPEHVLSGSEQRQLELLKEAFLRGRKMSLREWPELKMMFPWGDPLFVPPFLREDKELAELIDGQGIDEPLFERLPEMQIGQAAGHRKWQLRQEWKKVGKEPEYIFVEGNFVPAIPGGVTETQQADYIVRTHLHFLAYNMYNLPAGITGVSSADYYGEEHYGGGYPVGRLPHLCPRPAYSAYATLTRHLNRKNFIKYVPTGSETVFCLQFKHYQSDELTHVLWTVRGERPVTLSAPADSEVEVYDQMDNRVAWEAKRGRGTITVGLAPCFVEGLSAAPRIALGEPEHSDSQPGKRTKIITNFGDGKWTLKAMADKTYEHNHPHQMARFLGRMSATAVDAPQAMGGKALAIHLKKQKKERITMPWYTALLPDEPIVIDGKASHLGIWVRANSDWGRVIYSLRDAKGERWASIGSTGAWNCDDTHGVSSFNFDGWRYLRFEMPANAPYDSYRENGSTWWGHFEGGDGIVDLPLRLEKVIVERRTHVMYVNEPVKANPADVLLGDLMAEYASEADQGDEAIRLSWLRMPVPADTTVVENPIEKMALRGMGAATRVTGIDLPMHGPDGTKCHVNFRLVEGATSYDIWAGPHAEGRGAKLLAGGLTASGPLVHGFLPEVDFYLFVVYKDREGKASKPSAPFKIRLQDMFLQK